MNKTASIVIIALVVGGLIGFALNGNEKNTMPEGIHEMADGTMMVDDMMDTDGMEQMMHDMNAELIGKTGAEFDQAFVEQMVIHHEGAVAMAELALTNAESQELKDLATAIITAQNSEIELMNSWRSAW
jgi:uncharacterized protein (DUF305 family)